MHQLDVDKMLARLPNHKFMEWVAFYLLEEEDAAEERKKSAKSASTPNKNTSSISL